MATAPGDGLQGEAVLAIEALRIHYELPAVTVRAVDGVDLEVRGNEVLGLAGESGSGKSTLALGVLQLLRPPGRVVAGRVRFGDVDLLELEERDLRALRWRQFAYIPQGSMSALNPVMRLRSQFTDTLAAHGESMQPAALRERLTEVLQGVGLEADILPRYPHELSGGMRQRVCIALALLLGPRLIIADEPTSALDVISQRVVLETLAAARQAIGASMLLIGHDLALLAQVTDRLGVMYAGRIVELGATGELFANAQHPYTQRLIASIPDLHDRRAFGGAPPEDGTRWLLEAPLHEVAPGHFVRPWQPAGETAP
ncbi:MAG: ABC transporter ATP-binding protein [Anaerolineaceae bacterium]|nr:ABC transporter ATP-binding protein [Anaerolineaceae bacterium]MDE0328037.1 ABC transporter ATP-binding protein [Anaerolineaceae bacterium]